MEANNEISVHVGHKLTEREFPCDLTLHRENSFVARCQGTAYRVREKYYSR